MPRRRLSVTRCCTRCSLEGFPSVNGSTHRSDAMIHLTNVVLFLVSYGIGILVYLEMSAGTKISWRSRKNGGNTACWIWKLDFLTNAPKKTQTRPSWKFAATFVRQYKSTTRTTMRRGVASGICPSVAETHNRYQWWISILEKPGKPSCLHLEISGVIWIIGLPLKWLSLFRGDSMLG